ncbi:hypothetical protein H0H92_007110 [Tricholoma furcatifolium]|nr:hypothetical protein H0H92_007110 [Tricholoma furcatifolium]
MANVSYISSLNNDILLDVFEALEEICNSGSQGSKRSLLSAALTCSMFNDPATAILWKSMDSISPLIQLLPTVELVNGIYMICGAIREENMERFTFYAKKIRHFTRSLVDHRGQQIPPISPSVYALLEPVLHLQYLVFTSVQALSTPETSFFIPYCSTFSTTDTASFVSASSPLRWVGPRGASASITSSSTLRRLEIRDGTTNNSRDLDKDFSHMRPFIYSLQTRAPKLRQLVISIRTSSKLWELIVDFKHLRSLEFSGIIDVVLFRRLALSLPELQRLVVDFLDTPPLPISFPVTNPKTNITFPFDKLRTLRISGRGSTVASYLLCIESRAVEDFAVVMAKDLETHPRFSASEQWEICMSVMKEQWAPKLRSVRLETSQMGLLQFPSAMFFSELSTISLTYIGIEAKISVEDCRRLSRSLKSITDLYIHLVSASGIPNLPPDDDNVLRSDIFMSFAAHCQTLFAMELTFQNAFPSFCLDPDNISRFTRGHPLRSLSIASNDRLDLNNLQHAVRAARLLCTVFPRLEALHTPNNHASAAFWGYVYELYKELRGSTITMQKKL